MKKVLLAFFLSFSALILTAQCNLTCSANIQVPLFSGCQRQLANTDLLQGGSCNDQNYTFEFQLLDAGFNPIDNDWDLLVTAPGDYVYQCQVYDESNVQVVNCWGTFTALDNTAPVLNCVSSKTVELGLDGNGILSLSDVVTSSSDNCQIASFVLSRNNPGPDDTNSEIHFSCTDLSNVNDCATIANIMVTLTVTDDAGFYNTCTASITVEDLNIPQITWPVDITLDCFEGFSAGNNPPPTLTGEPTADNSCLSDVFVFVFDDDPAATTPGGFQIARNWLGLDFCNPGSTFNHTQTITILIEDENGVCPTVNFINVMNWQAYATVQEAVEEAEDGDMIIINTENVGDIELNESKTITLTSNNLNHITIGNIGIVADGHIILDGVTAYHITGEIVTDGIVTDGFAALTLKNTDGIVTDGLIDLSGGFVVDVCTQLEILGPVTGGGPGSQFNLKPGNNGGPANGIKIILGNDGEIYWATTGIAPADPNSGEAGPYLGAKIVNGNTPDRYAFVGAGLISESFPSNFNGGTSSFVNSTSAVNELISPCYVDHVWRIKYLDQFGNSMNAPYELELNFPIELQIGENTIGIPLVAVKYSGLTDYYLGELNEGRLLTSAGEVADPNYRTVAFNGLGCGGDIAIFNCATCDNGQAQMCVVSPNNPNEESTQCVSKTNMIGHIENGSYCGPCTLKSDPDGINCSNNNIGYYEPETETYVLSSESCYNPTYYSTTDAHGFMGTNLCGDGEIIAQVNSVEGSGWAGITMREGTGASEKMIQLSLDGVFLSKRELRVNPGNPAFAHQYPTQGRNWLRLARKGPVFSAYHSTDGTNWMTVLVSNIAMSNCIKIGLITENGTPDGSVTGTFKNVKITSGGNSAFNLPPNGIQHTSYEQQEATVLVYPNPVSDQLFVAFNTPFPSSQMIRLIGLNGRIVRQQFVEKDAFQIMMDVKGLTPGIYFLHLTGEGQNDQIKIIIQ